MTLKTSDKPDQTVGIDASRSALLTAYAHDLPAAFQSLLTAGAPPTG